VSEHNPNAWQDGFDAWQNGYDDAMYDGIDTSSEMPCKCEACLKGYAEGQEAALKEIFAGSQSAQPLRAVDAPKPCDKARDGKCFNCGCEQSAHH